MNILFFLNPGEKGGSNKSTYMLAKKLSENYQLKPIIITPKWNLFNDMAIKDGLETMSINYLYNGTHSNAGKFRKIIKILINKVYYYRGFKELDKKYDWNNTFIHSGMSILGIGSYVAKKTGAYHVMHLRENPFPWVYLFEKEIQYMNSEVDAFIGISNDMTQNWVKAGILPEKISTIYNGVDDETINCKNHSTDSEKIGIMINGWLSEAKGTDIALKAMAQLPSELRKKVYVDFYGVGTDENKTKSYEQMVIDLEINDFVTLKGYTEDIPKLLSQYDIGLMNSKREAFGRTTIEYMLAGLATIASNTGANTELIEDKKTGLLYEFGNEFELAERISQLVKDTELLDMLSNNGQKYAKKHFTADKNAENVFKLYQELDVFDKVKSLN